MRFAKKHSFYFPACVLLIVLFGSACSTQSDQYGGNTQATRQDVIQPCAQQFHPQTVLRHTVTGALTQNLYFISGVHLYALNAGNGTLHWCLLISNAQSHLSQEAAVLGPLAFIPAPPDGLDGLAVQDNNVFVTTQNSSTYAFSTDTGKKVWQHDTGYAGGTPLIANDTIYVPAGAIYALSTQNGSKRWSYSTKDVVTLLSAIVDGTLYAGSYDNAVYALDAASGKARWIYHTDGRISIAPIVDHGVVYVGSGNGGPRLYAIDAQSGKLLWRTNTIMNTDTQLLVADGMLYTCQNNSLVGLDPKNGKVLWSYNGICGAALLAHGHVLYVASGTGDLCAFDTQTHALIWQVKQRTLGSGPVARLKLLGDELYVGFDELGQSQLANIHAINARSGSEDWSASVKWNMSTLDIA